MYTNLEWDLAPRFGTGASLEGCSRINVLVGPNNSGKSTVLRRLGNGPIGLSKFSLRDAPLRASLVEGISKLSIGVGRASVDYTSLGNLPADLRFENTVGLQLDRGFLDDILRGMGVDPSSSPSLGGSSGPDTYNDIREMINRIASSQFTARSPRHYYFPSDRTLSLNGGPAQRGASYTREGLSQKLRQVQESLDEQPLELLRQGLEPFLELFRSHRLCVVGVQDEARVVLMNVNTLQKIPLDDLGDGVQQLILIVAPIVLDSILASAKTLAVIVLEEPETHLHPTLWRSLLHFLKDATSTGKAQLFLSTHSPSVITSLIDCAIFGTSQADRGRAGGCQIRRMNESLAQVGLDLDLAGRPAHQQIVGQLLLGGRVLVVEGPSDQIVFQHLLECLAMDDVQAVNVLGDHTVDEAVTKINEVFPGSVLGITDKAKGATAGRPEVHVLRKGNLERYFTKDGRPLIKARSRKPERAMKVIRGEDGYTFADKNDFLAEVTAFLSGAWDVRSLR